ncbi:MAG TPA: hypothetical protein VMH86_15685 [Rhizomicrobium sp.]|nr:hypothetical protein [Rhizomicrobium sp.]
MKTTLAMAAMAATIGLGALAVSTPASAYTEQRCDRDGCWLVNCDSFGQDCYRVWNSGYARAPYRDWYYDRFGVRHFYDTSHRVCDADGDNCFWTDHPY